MQRCNHTIELTIASSIAPLSWRAGLGRGGCVCVYSRLTSDCACACVFHQGTTTRSQRKVHMELREHRSSQKMLLLPRQQHLLMFTKAISDSGQRLIECCTGPRKTRNLRTTSPAARRLSSPGKHKRLSIVELRLLPPYTSRWLDVVIEVETRKRMRRRLAREAPGTQRKIEGKLIPPCAGSSVH